MAGKLVGKDRSRLQSLETFAPNAIKIILTAYPSALTTLQALTIGADAYIIKPIDPDELLKTIRTKLSERLEFKEEVKSTGEKSTGRVIQKFEPEEFHQYLENMADGLVSFGLTVNQAKIYVALVAIEPAPVSKIAAACRIRREEVYRMLPDLADMGIIVKKLGNPISYIAVPPEEAIQFLIKLKVKKAAEELNVLNTKSDHLISKLKKTEPADNEPLSIEYITNAENFFEQFLRANERVNKNIDAIMSSELLHYTQINFGYLIKKLQQHGVKTRIILEESMIANYAEGFAKIAKDDGFLIPQVRQLLELKSFEALPFNAVIFDNKEAIWGNFKFTKEGSNLWSNLPFHVEMVKAAFDSLWQKAKPLQNIQVEG